MFGIGIKTFFISSQSKVSLALPHELNREYLLNSLLSNSIDKYAGNNVFVSSTLNTIYDEEHIYVSSLSFLASDIFSPFLEVTVTYANSSGFTTALVSRILPPCLPLYI